MTQNNERRRKNPGPDTYGWHQLYDYLDGIARMELQQRIGCGTRLTYGTRNGRKPSYGNIPVGVSSTGYC